jgi:hypothetical protein
MKNRELVLLSVKSVDQPPRIMYSERSLTLPYRGDNTIQGPITRAFTRDITNHTQVPDFKLRLEVLRRDNAGFSEMIE